MTRNESIICKKVCEVFLTPGSIARPDENTDLERAFALSLDEKQSFLTQLEDAFGIPVPPDAVTDVANLNLSHVPWVVSALARYLETRQNNEDVRR